MFKKDPQLLMDAENNAINFLKSAMANKTKEQMFYTACMTLEMAAFLAGNIIDNFSTNGVIKEDDIDLCIEDFRNLVVFYHQKMVDTRNGKQPEIKPEYMH